MRTRIFGNLRVGRPHTSPSAPAHVPGVRGGNEAGAVHQAGFHSIGPADRRGISDVRGTARRSTGVSARAREPIDPASPNLQPC